jgi:hypothetical protein
MSVNAIMHGRSYCLTKTKNDELSSFYSSPIDNLTFNFNSLLGIVYVSFSKSHLFDEYAAISHRYDLKKVAIAIS